MYLTPISIIPMLQKFALLYCVTSTTEFLMIDLGKTCMCYSLLKVQSPYLKHTREKP